MGALPPHPCGGRSIMVLPTLCAKSVVGLGGGAAYCVPHTSNTVLAPNKSNYVGSATASMRWKVYRGASYHLSQICCWLKGNIGYKGGSVGIKKPAIFAGLISTNSLISH